MLKPSWAALGLDVAHGPSPFTGGNKVAMAGMVCLAIVMASCGQSAAPASVASVSSAAVTATGVSTPLAWLKVIGGEQGARASLPAPNGFKSVAAQLWLQNNSKSWQVVKAKSNDRGIPGDYQFGSIKFIDSNDSTLENTSMQYPSKSFSIPPGGFVRLEVLGTIPFARTIKAVTLGFWHLDSAGGSVYNPDVTVRVPMGMTVPAGLFPVEVTPAVDPVITCPQYLQLTPTLSSLSATQATFNLEIKNIGGTSAGNLQVNAELYNKDGGYDQGQLNINEFSIVPDQSKVVRANLQLSGTLGLPYLIRLSPNNSALCKDGRAAVLMVKEPQTPASAVASGRAIANPAGPTTVSAQPAPQKASSASEGNLVPVKVGYSQASPAYGPLYAASELGLFAKQGLTVDLTQATPPALMTSLNSGELQFVMLDGFGLILNDVLGMPQVTMIAAASNYPVFSLFGAKGVNDVRSLGGKTVTFGGGPGTFEDAVTQMYLQRSGVTTRVNYRMVPSSEYVLTALQKDTDGAGLIAPPMTADAEKAGLKELVNGSKLGVPMTSAGIAVSHNYVASNPEIIRRFLQGYLDGWKLTLDSGNETALERALAKDVKSDDATAKAEYAYMYPFWSHDKVPLVNSEGLKTLLEFITIAQAKGAAPSQFIDNSMLQTIAGKS